MNTGNKPENAHGWTGMLSADAARARRLSAHGAAYSFFVRFAKFLLPVAALVLMGVVIARMQHDPLQDQLTQLGQDEKTVPGQSELIGARYEGVDEKGKPFVLTADKAMRVMPADAAAVDADVLPQGETVDLVRPRAEISAGARPLALSADKGRYAQGEQQLELNGDVILSDDRGNALQLQQVDVDLQNRALRSDAPVSGSGPDGSINAEGLRLEDGGDKVIFTGRTTLTLPTGKPPQPETTP